MDLLQSFIEFHGCRSIVEVRKKLGHELLSEKRKFYKENKKEKTTPNKTTGLTTPQIRDRVKIKHQNFLNILIENDGKLKILKDLRIKHKMNSDFLAYLKRQGFLYLENGFYRINHNIQIDIETYLNERAKKFTELNKKYRFIKS